MAAYLKKHLDNPGKQIDLLEKVINKLFDEIDLSAYEENTLKLTEVTKVIDNLTKKDIVEIMRRNLYGKFKKNDLTKKNGVELWIFNAARERNYMIREGMLKSGSPRGIWELRGR